MPFFKKALGRGGFTKTYVGATRSEADTSSPKAPHQKGASVFNRALLLKKVWAMGWQGHLGLEGPQIWVPC